MGRLAHIECDADRPCSLCSGILSPCWLTAQATIGAPTLLNRNFRVGGFLSTFAAASIPGGNTPGPSREAGAKGHLAFVVQQPRRVRFVAIRLRSKQRKDSAEPGLTVMNRTHMQGLHPSFLTTRGILTLRCMTQIGWLSTSLSGNCCLSNLVLTTSYCFRVRVKQQHIPPLMQQLIK